jgi:hypothetical protein
MDTVPSGMEVESASLHLPNSSTSISSIESTGRMQQMKRTISSKVSALRSNPAMIGGLATAAGFAVGLAGRYLRHRAHAPRVIVIEAI